MKFTIGAKLLFTFSGLLVVVIAIGWYTLLANQKALEEAVGQSSVFLVEDTIQRIDKDIFLKIEQLEQFTSDPLLQATLARSTSSGQAAGEVDLEALAERLRQVFIRFSELRYGYQNYSRVVVTNAQGEVVAQTGREAASNQSGKKEWQAARDTGSAIGGFEYDESVGVWGIPLSVRVEDGTGEFVGVVKAIVPAGVTVREEELVGKKYATTNVALLTDAGETIYETGAFRFLEDVSQENFFSYIGEASGFFVTEQVGKEKLFSYAHSPGFRDYEGLGWVLVMSHDTAEVFAPARSLRNILLVIIGILILVIGALALILSRSISRPIKRLTETARDIAGGSLEKRAKITSQDEIGQLGKAFNFMTEKLQKSQEQLKQQIVELKELDRLKDDFLNNSTHELKTPLIPIKSQVQLLLAEDYGSLNSEQKKSIEMIARNEDQLESLVSDVVDITKIRSGKLKLVKAPADLTDIITMAVQDWQELAREREIHLGLQFGTDFPVLTIDAKRITQVLGNVLNNALKFTTTGGEVNVTATVEEDKAVVRIADTGIGMNARTLRKVFTPFFQAQSDEARKYEGTGLGLAISKGFIEGHGGTIAAESAGEGKGSTISFSLPIDRDTNT